MDKVDEQLINLLSQDAYQSSNTLAKQINVSASTVRRRMNKLLRRGALRIVGRVEPSAVGFPLTALIAFDVDHHSLNPVMAELSNQSEVRWLAATSGRFDVIALAWFASTDKLYSFMEDKLSKMEGIRNTESFICLHVVKRL